MKTSRTNHTLNKIGTALVVTALVAAASYVSPVEAATNMIYGAIGDDGSGPPGIYDSSLTVSVRTHESGGGRLPEYAVNGNGIGVTGDATVPANYWHDAHNDNGDFDNNLSAGDGGIGWFKVDLGQTYTLDHALLFNFNPDSLAGNESRGTSNAVIYYLDAASDPNANNDENGNAFDPTGWSMLNGGATQTFARAPAGNVNQLVPDTINFGGVSARFVALDILSNHGHPNYVGLGEIQFFEAAAGDAGTMVYGK